MLARWFAASSASAAILHLPASTNRRCVAASRLARRPRHPFLFPEARAAGHRRV